MSSQGHSVSCPAPLVSVSITAFNSERWLAKAIESALRQRTDFATEIVIGDDFSTDGTLAVALSWQQRHPDRIRVLERTRNIGMQRNFYDTFEQCRGRYIAWLDADDFWTDPEKLTVQVQLLESDPSVSVCCHFVRWVSPEGEVKRERYPGIPPGRYGLADILRRDFVPSPSIVFRNGIQRGLPSGFFQLSGMADWPLLVLAALSGDIVLLDRVMADYMLAPGSAMTSKGDRYWHTMDVEFYDFVLSMLPARWHRLVGAEQGKRYEALAYLLRSQGDFRAARAAAVNAFRTPALLDNALSKSRMLIGVVLRELESRVRRRDPDRKSPV
jgi:glycosyltransferase involved in cell wall biosynthesis